MKVRTGPAAGSNRARDGLLEMTDRRSRGTPRAARRSPRASLTVRMWSAKPAEARSWSRSSQAPGRRSGPGKRLRKNSGMASWKSRITGTPTARSGAVAKTSQSGSVATWTAA